MTEEDIAGRVFGVNGSACAKEADAEEKGRFKEIIDGCRANEPSSQEKLYKQFYGYALAVALAYCYSREDAVEVVNDSFIKVFRNIRTFVSTEPFRPWLRKIVVNTSIDRIRANKKYRNHVEDEDLQHVSRVDIESELTAKQMYALLNELPDLLRFVFNMYEIEGYSHREIADRLEIAESSSRTYLTRAKTRLRHLYGKLFTGEQ